jgi:ribosome-associated translation inhibitor RaiA
MNHPKHEEWVQYLFGETPAETSRQLKGHLRSCSECREEIEGWKTSLGRLSAWKLPPAATPREIFQPFLKWAAAPAIILCLGFGIGRFTFARADVETVRAAIEPAMRQQLRQEVAQLVRDEQARAADAALATSGAQTRKLLADYAKGFELRRTEDNQAIYAALDKLDAQRIADALSLKKELDTVAVNTDAGLRHTEQELVQLAGYTQPSGSLNAPQK